jgi:hypothetical protein
MNDNQLAELIANYHIARVMVGDGRYARLRWAAAGFHREHPEVTELEAYKELTGYLDFLSRPLPEYNTSRDDGFNDKEEHAS